MLCVYLIIRGKGLAEKAFGFAFCAEVGVLHDLVEAPFDVIVFGEHVLARDGAQVV